MNASKLDEDDRIVWVVAPEDQGQHVEYAYGVDPDGDGVLLRIRYPGGPTEYRYAPWVLVVGEFDPLNVAPTVGHWERVRDE